MPLHLICMHEPDIHFPEIGLQNNFKMFSPIQFPKAAEYISPAVSALSTVCTVVHQ